MSPVNFYVRVMTFVWPVRTCAKEMLRLMFNNDVTARDANGNTALHIAAAVRVQLNVSCNVIVVVYFLFGKPNPTHSDCVCWLS